MEKIYEVYLIADGLLRELKKQPLPEVPVINGQRVYKGVNLNDILIVNKLAEMKTVNGENMIFITEDGKNHIASGGFRETLCLRIPDREEISFSAHLENNSGLLSTFGVLNAIILFAASKDFADSDSGNPFFSFGVKLVSAAMFIVSILVLNEIIRNTSAHSERRKFKLFYLSMYATTMGIVLLFSYKFLIPLLYFAVICLLLTILWVIFSKTYILFFRFPFEFSLGKKARLRAVLALFILLFAALLALMKLEYPEVLINIQPKK